MCVFVSVYLCHTPDQTKNDTDLNGIMIYLKLLVSELFSKNLLFWKTLEVRMPRWQKVHFFYWAKIFFAKNSFLKVFASIKTLENMKIQKHPDIAHC